MPPMLQVMKDIGGVEMPEYLAKLTGGSDPGGGQGRADGQRARGEGGGELSSGEPGASATGVTGHSGR